MLEDMAVVVEVKLGMVLVVRIAVVDVVVMVMVIGGGHCINGDSRFEWCDDSCASVCMRVCVCLCDFLPGDNLRTKKGRPTQILYTRQTGQAFLVPGTAYLRKTSIGYLTKD